MTDKRAFISVYDKTGVEDLARELTDLGFEIVSSGGTAKKIADAGIPVISTADLTGYPDILGHRVVTLHPMVHGGILGDRDNSEHVQEMERYGIKPFGIVVVNFYPFEKEPSIEQIDIGGPALVRAAAKNFAHVGVVTDPVDYPMVVTELREAGNLSELTREELAIKAFAYVTIYDMAILAWMSDGEYKGFLGGWEQACGYGENRNQSPAILYSLVGNSDPLAVAGFTVVAGQNPGYINLTDVDRLLYTVTHLVAGHKKSPDGWYPYIAVAVKHGNACGVGIGESPKEALELMLTGDPQAIFGGVVMTNFQITGELAQALLHYKSEQHRRLLSGICAPSFDDEALKTLGRKDGKYFLATNPALSEVDSRLIDRREHVRFVRGGFLTEPNYKVLKLSGAEVQGVSLTKQQWRDLVTGIAICGTSNSNTITLVKNGQLIGNGVGQQDRVGAAELAVKKALDAGHDIEGAVAVSDSYFPFADGPRVLIDAGVRVIFSTTGSLRDSDTQRLCQQTSVTLVQLPDEHARMFFGH